MLKLCLGFLVDTLFCVKWLARLSIFIHDDIIVLVSEFVVVVILSDCQPLWTHALLNLKFVILVLANNSNRNIFILIFSPIRKVKRKGNHLAEPV